MYDRDNEVWREVQKHAALAAARVHQRWHRWAERQDLMQAALEYAWRKRELVESFLDREDKEERKRGERALFRTLARAAERYARKEKASRSGYEWNDEQFYNDSMVEGLLQAWAFDDAHLAGQVLDPAEMGGRRKKVLSEGNNLLAMLADVGAAFDKLDPRTRGVLYARIVESRTLVDVGEAWEISPQRVDQIHRQGMNKMIELLGGERPY